MEVVDGDGEVVCWVEESRVGIFALLQGAIGNCRFLDTQVSQ